ncbi:MAG TPA: methylenetetrahydrofolate reductase, partial [Paracoccaceae bacterium]|nr:methylenetetrahydrofolate reductase [Paracoccaceae bacterium]
ARLGARAVVALRGDPPKGEARFVPHPEGFRSAAELVAALKTDGVQDIYVAAYPEVHPEAASPEADLDNLKRKVDAGATAAISQFFFDLSAFLRFRDKAAARGVKVPIHPGILPVENFPRMCNFAERCKASVPNWMRRAFGHCDTDEDRTVLATAIASDQCDRLRREGVGHFHFYTLNNPDLTFNICRALGFEALPLSVAVNGAG